MLQIINTGAELASLEIEKLSISGYMGIMQSLEAMSLCHGFYLLGGNFFMGYSVRFFSSWSYFVWFYLQIGKSPICWSSTCKPHQLPAFFLPPPLFQHTLTLSLKKRLHPKCCLAMSTTNADPLSYYSILCFNIWESNHVLIFYVSQSTWF